MKMKSNFSRLSIVTVIFASTLSLPMAFAEDDASSLHVLYRNPDEKLRAPASSLPEDLAASFTVAAPEREPAAVKKKNTKAPKSALKRRSRLPATIANGIELRVQYNKLNSMFWLVERGSTYDLVYANSAGSKASLGLSSDDFKAMHRLALGFQPYEGDLSKCKESTMQMHVVTAGQAERTVTMCVNTKGPMAEKLRGLSQSLAALVR